MTLNLSRRTPRRILAAALGLSLAVGLAACSNDDSDSSAATDSTTSENDSSVPAGYYPHTQKTSRGDITIESQPTRVVALTANIADEMLSLGVTPVAVATTPEQLDTYYPWVADELRDLADPNLIKSNDVNIEAVAEHNPDLVIGQSAHFTDDADWDKIQSVTTTIVPESSAANAGWEKSLETTAAALGLKEKAEGIITDIKDSYSRTGVSSKGKTYNFLSFWNNSFGFPNGTPFELFGLVPAENQGAMVGKKLSRENMDQIQSDFLVIYLEDEKTRDDLRNDPAFQNIPAVKKGNYEFVGTVVTTALGGGVSALYWLLDRISPIVEKLK